ncbi:nucleotide-binding universal stress UspA family protein [Winogradskyella pacifica]|uniref:Nucleotide-binding universal stress UspA family protein n=1 Tax=Winogradskyella pacifica TaxID=664642 RepID=A0A3D9LMX3_9FLAO|nr:universal stress protein [Winogradskyella pacifica]REE07737.1 nucleotide-binding universal stress UspA family protein [Winogradskyella pacifica]
MKQILLPTDFSENSWNAITYAINLYKDEECTFHLFNAYTPVIYNIEYVLGYPAQFGLADAIRNTSQKNLNTLITKISNEFEPNPNHKFETYARFNTLISGIKEFIDEHDIDLIFMGTKGATGAKEVLFGSNTVHIFKEIKCPVVAIPSGFAYEAPHEILFPTDLNAMYKHSTLKILKEIVLSNNARLNTMHVSTGYELTEKQERNKAQLESMFENSAFLFHNIKAMDITNAINEFQVKHKINLLVMINNKHSFFENIFFKNTINQIGFHLNIPFLVIPTEL